LVWLRLQNFLNTIPVTFNGKELCHGYKFGLQKKKKKKRMTNFAQEADITKIIILHQLLLSETSHRRGRYNFLLSTNINLLEFY